MDPTTRAHRYDELLAVLRTYGRVVVAYSGGVDSTLVVKAAVDALGAGNVIAATGVSASLAPREQSAGREVLEILGLAGRLRLVETSEQDDPDYQANAPDRCFHCKTDLYSHLIDLAREEQFDVIANGANVDDLGDFRPGMDAARDYRVRSPLIEAEFTKDDVRAAARAVGLPNWDKPAAPCLASRIPHGQEVDTGKLDQIARAEAYLQDLGLAGFRVRHHGDLARIELPADVWEFFEDRARRQMIEEEFKRLGFRFVALDLGGYRQGKAVIR